MQDVPNTQMVCLDGTDTVYVLRPKVKMTKLEAVLQAAWLVAIADDNDEFEATLDAVRNT